MIGRNLCDALKQKFPDFQGDLGDATKEALKAIAENVDALDALADPNKTKADFVAYVDALALVGVDAAAKADLATKLYGAYQLNRLRAEDAAIAEELDTEDPVSDKVKAVINKLGECVNTKDVEDFLSQDAGKLSDAIAGLRGMPVADAPAITNAFFGRAEYNKMLAAARDAGNNALVAVLLMPDHADAIKAKFGDEEDNTLRVSVSGILTNPASTKDDILQSLQRDLDLALPNADNHAANIFAHHQFKQNLNGLWVSDEIRRQLNANTVTVISQLATKNTPAEAQQLFAALNAAQDKPAVRTALADLGVPVTDPVVNAIFAEKQFERLFADYGVTNPKLCLQLQARKAQVIAKLGVLADPNAVTQLAIAVIDGAKEKNQVTTAMDALGLGHADANNVNALFAENQLNRYLNDTDFADANQLLHQQMHVRKDQVQTAFSAKNTIAEVNTLVQEVQDTAKNKADLIANMTALGLDAAVDANKNAIFAENQYNRLLTEAGVGTKLHDQLIASKDTVIDQLKTKATVQDVTDLRGAVVNTDLNKEQLVAAMTALGLDVSDANKNALFGENQHQRLLVAHGGTILHEQLAARKNEVVAVLGQKAIVAEITPLVAAVQNHRADKVALAGAMTALGLDGAQVNNLFGENQLARVTAALLAASEIRVAFNGASDATKRMLKVFLGTKADAAACDLFIDGLKSAEKAKDEITLQLDTAGFRDEAERKTAAKKIYRDNQFADLQTNWVARGHTQLKQLIEANADAFKQKLEDSPAFDTPAKVKSLWNCVSTVDLKTKLTAAGINATDEQLKQIVAENRAAQIPDTNLPASQALIDANPKADFDKKIGVLKKEEDRIEEMFKYITNAEFSRSELKNKEGLARLDVSVHRLTAIMKEYVQLCKYYAAAGADYTAELAKLEELNTKLLAMRTKLTHLETLAGTPTKIKAHGENVEARVHEPLPAHPQYSSYDLAGLQIRQFFDSNTSVAGSMVKGPDGMTTDAWAAGVSRSKTQELQFDYQQAVTNRTVQASVKVGIIQTEIKHNPADTTSSYRQNFFFKEGDEAKMSKGKRQVSTTDKSVSIPADHVMRWANDAVKDFLAFASADDRVITINAGSMPKPCIEALAVMCKVNNVPFRVRGTNLDISTTEMSAKADLAKKIYGSQLQTAETVTKGEYIRPRP